MSYNSFSYNIVANKGTDFILYVRYLDSDNNGVGLTQEGFTAAMQVRRHSASTTTLLDFNSQVFGAGGVTAGNTGGSGGIKLNVSATGDVSSTAATGGIFIQADSSTMRNVPSGRHFFELDLLNGSSVLRLIEGRFEVSGDIRR